MRGVEYVVDDQGNRKAVVIDLKTWGRLWEDFHDAMLSQLRESEPAVPWGQMKAEMEREATKAD